MYEVEYLDGEWTSLAANNIAKNLLAQFDDECNCQVLMDEIIGHRSDEHAMKQQDAFITTKTEGAGKQQKVGNYLYDGRTAGLIGYP